MVMVNYYERIKFMEDILAKYGVPFFEKEIYEGYQLRFRWTIGDVAVHNGTYGAAYGKVETYEFPWDEGDVSELWPEEAAMKIVEYYNSIMDEDEK